MAGTLPESGQRVHFLAKCEVIPKVCHIGPACGWIQCNWGIEFTWNRDWCPV
jgi:hypothetical protein